MGYWSSPGNRGPLDIRMPPGYCPHAPTVKQHAAMLPEWLLELLYGGQAGGGKSDWLLMGALQYVDVRGYAALILRRSFQDLRRPGAIMSRAKEWLANTDATWNENNHEFTFPSGAKIEFGFLKSDDDVFNYQSAEYQYIGVDELTQFTEFQYTYLMSRLRRPSGIEDNHPLARVPLRCRTASNPGGPGHQWVRRRLVEADHPERMFIPAGLDDNPHLDRVSYKRALSMLDDHTRAQLEFGDWTARPPGPWVFNHKHIDAAIERGAVLDQKRKNHELAEPVGGNLKVGADFGEAAHFVIGWPLERKGMYLCGEHTFEHGEPDVEAYRVIEKCDGIGWLCDRMRYDASKPESARLAWRTFRRERGEGYGRPSAIAFAKYKRAAILHQRRMLRLSYKAKEDPDTLGYLAISPTMERYIAQIYELQFKGEDTEDLVKLDDHGPDAAFALITPLTKAFDNETEERDAVYTGKDVEHA